MTDIITYLPGIALAYAAFMLAIVSPGPNILAIIGTSMSVSRKSGSALASGVATGTLIWSSLTVVGLSALLATYAFALTVIKIFGGIYLLWLAFKAFKSASAKQDVEAVTLSNAPETPIKFYFRGLIIQMTNPKAALVWIAIISLGLQNDAPWWVGFSIVAGTSILSLLIHNLYAFAFSTQLMVRLYGRARRAIQYTLGSVFAFAGLKLLSSEV